MKSTFCQDGLEGTDPRRDSSQALLPDVSNMKVVTFLVHISMRTLELNARKSVDQKLSLKLAIFISFFRIIFQLLKKAMSIEQIILNFDC